jgi:hypothetical protein
MDYLISHGSRKIVNYDEAGQEIKQNEKLSRKIRLLSFAMNRNKGSLHFNLL